ncbi:monooxygenase [Couchioplanes caeruleus]|uniref:Monooxygenase n=2 Tax=Couchioplanes caeruleus TaxID=56438 RepID=A0A1K0GTV2_9ACTN|nr:monooxygenase [Couchioplanes caeruleus]OJF12731.1 monooxygenase [Couchioplanes caeruleus subsp. caeruleus]ROP29234.1 spheroidene monooxygenase [Couchioplanes caeruleus]
MVSVPPLVTLHVWRVPRRSVGRALVRMAMDPRRLRRLPGVRFGKLLGTGTGTSFGPGDADLTRYAAVVSWDRVSGGDLGRVGAAWEAIATAAARVDLRPLTSRGRWSGAVPFGEPSGGPEARRQETRRGDGPVLALTRARLRPAKALTFWTAVPPVARELAAAPGLLARFGIGEAPVGWQGTVSLWRGAADLTRFAYRQPEHRAVIARTTAVRWYAEDLFARFAVLDISGDRAVLGWREGER